MSAAERTQEFADNLAAGREYAGGDRVSPELRAEIAAAVDELEAKRESQQLEIVAFGTISSGKSSLLNALAGRHVFRTNVVGGTTITRSEIPWPARRPRRAGRYAGSGRSARRSAGGRGGRGGEECRPGAVRRRWAAEGVRERAARSTGGDGEADRRLPQQRGLVRRRAARRTAAADCRAGRRRR